MPSSFRSTSRPSRPSVWLKVRRTAVYGPVCTVVWEGRRARLPPIPMGTSACGRIVILLYLFV
jgi:hypothetical protein